MGKNQVVELYYQLPEAAHEQLCGTRAEIRLLADLSARISDEADDLQLSPKALTRCFDRLAGESSVALHESFWPAKRGWIARVRPRCQARSGCSGKQWSPPTFNALRCPSCARAPGTPWRSARR
ncbi:XAC0095 family protein [Rhodanobacter terrae]|uniref:XAC0095 family protein n=1 Tax=Rhodanobacter terrae TaxID=418647 RepID=A0ABW0T329_9GAMM